jgi:Nickel responsive protein SCO4226-like
VRSSAAVETAQLDVDGLSALGHVHAGQADEIAAVFPAKRESDLDDHASGPHPVDLGADARGGDGQATELAERLRLGVRVGAGGDARLASGERGALPRLRRDGRNQHEDSSDRQHRRQSYCLYEAPSPDEIMAAARRANIPADVIVEVDQVSADMLR